MEEAPPAWVVDTRAEAARSATNAAKSVTSLATALMEVLGATEVEATAEVAMEEEEVDTEVARSRPATLAAATDTCLATVLRVRNATTVSALTQHRWRRLTVHV